jgi:uncharacterized OB-fold protein
VVVASSKPVPLPDDADRPYWDALKEGRLVVARCEACGGRARRRPMVCPNCRGERFSWSEVSGRGTIYAFTVARQTWVAGFSDELPYVVVAVALDEQPSLLVTANLVGTYAIEELDIGLPVTAVFEPRGDEALVQFQLAGAGLAGERLAGERRV